MDQFLSTYRKDFLWPYENFPFGPGAEDASLEEAAFVKACEQRKRPPDCRCFCMQQGGGGAVVSGAQGHGMVPIMDGRADWSRVGPMGQLLDPKLYPAKVGASPETPTSRFDQPNAFLDKLQVKFPMLYSILQNAPNADMRTRIERDRNKSTYQKDYCESGPGMMFENLQRAGGVSGMGECSGPVKLPGDPCRVRQKPRFVVARTITAEKNQQNDLRQKCDPKAAALTQGRTEYQDSIAKLGGIIIRDKLHLRR